jgi:hypothetical protein
MRARARDRGKMEALWRPQYRAWFPDGLDDPDLGLLKVSIEAAEYWDSPSSPVVHLIGLARAVLTGEPPRQMGDHGKIDHPVH